MSRVVDCDRCDGTGTWTRSDGSRWRCAYCKGTGKVLVETTKRATRTCPDCGREIGVHVFPQHRKRHADPTSTLRFTREEQDKMIRLYNQRGASLRSVSEQCYVSASAVRRVLVRNGVPLRSRGTKRGRALVLSTDEILRTTELYGAGMTMTELASLFGVHASTIHERLHRYGAHVRSVGGKHPPPRDVETLRELEHELELEAVGA